MKLKHLALVAGALFVALAVGTFPIISFAQDSTFDHLVNAACAEDGLTLKWLAGLFGTSVAASLLANFRGKLPAIVVRVLDVLALNIMNGLRQSAQAAKKTAPLLMLGAVLALSACVAPTGNLAADLAASHQKFLADTKALNEGAVVALKNANEDLAALRPALAQVCGAIAYNDGLFKLVAPLAGADPAALAVEGTAMLAANIACAATADPAAPQPTLASALVTAAQAYAAVQQDVAKTAPDVAAAVAAAPAS